MEMILTILFGLYALGVFVLAAIRGKKGICTVTLYYGIAQLSVLMSLEMAYRKHWFEMVILALLSLASYNHAAYWKREQKAALTHSLDQWETEHVVR